MTPLSLRFAARELRAGIRGFRIFLACLALGVAAIAATGSTAEAFRQGLSSQAREILGGDLAVSTNQDFTSAQRQAFARTGPTALAVAVRAMGQSPSGSRRLVELRGVDDAYPLAGTVRLEGPDRRSMTLAALRRAGRGAAAWAAVEPALLDRLKLRVGEEFTVGDAHFVAAAVLVSEPDRMSRDFQLGPAVLTSEAAVRAAGFVQPGYPIVETARIALSPGADLPSALRALRARLPGTAFRIRDRNDAAPGIGRLIDRLEFFLGFIGLASLLAGGLGVAGAVSAYLEARKPSIAVLKALGADSALVRNLYLFQITVLAALGIVIGLILGAAAPFLVAAIAGDKLPIPALFAVYPAPLARAALFGALSAAAFGLAPLARARLTPPAALFRQALGGRMGLGVETLGAALAAAGLAAVAVFTAPSAAIAAVMIGGVAAAFCLLWLMGRASAWLAGRGRGLAKGAVRLGLANLAGPRSAARTAAPAVGLGVALMACVVLIQSSLLAEVREAAPRTAPALVMTEIPGDRAAAFDVEAAKDLGRLTPDRYMNMPTASGRIIRAAGRPVDAAHIDPGQRWLFDRDIVLSLIDGEPASAGIVAGRWWPADYHGPPLAAVQKEAAKAAGLKLGDTITLELLGRQIDARVAVLRDVQFGGFGPGFSIILNKDALKGAVLRHVVIAKATKAQEAAVIRRLGVSFPQVNVISVREQLEAAAGLFDRLALAIRGAAAVAALAGLLVLIGAIAAGARTRAREAAILKVLGAVSGQILLAYGLEYGAVGAIAGLAGVGLGLAAAWPVVVTVFQTPWSVDWAGVVALIAGAALLALLGGLAAASQALANRPAPILRAE